MPLSFLEAEHLRISRESAEFSAPKGFARHKAGSIRASQWADEAVRSVAPKPKLRRIPGFGKTKWHWASGLSPGALRAAEIHENLDSHRGPRSIVGHASRLVRRPQVAWGGARLLAFRV